jgi:hypothetical protein
MWFRRLNMNINVAAQKFYWPGLASGCERANYLHNVLEGKL